MSEHIKRYIVVALALLASAILLFSCQQGDAEDDDDGAEKMMTEYSENLTILMSQNGRKSYHFTTSLMEGYSLAKEPYREFREGVNIVTYNDDSLSSWDTKLSANYAIYFEKRELWEAKGNVVVEKSDGRILYTEQLYWNAKTDKIYSNVDSKVVEKNGADVFVGDRFESDKEFKQWLVRSMNGRMEVEVPPPAEDSTAMVAEPESKPVATVATVATVAPTAPKPAKPATTDVVKPKPARRVDILESKQVRERKISDDKQNMIAQ